MFLRRTLLLYFILLLLGSVAVTMRGSAYNAVSVSSGSPNARREYLIVDTDVGVDDFLAISLMLQNMPKLNYKLIGLTTVQGIQLINESSTNIARFFTGANYPTSTYVGASTPVGGHPFPSSIDDRDRSDLIFNFPICNKSCTNTIKDISALDFLLESSKSHPGKLSILAIGPLTNIANAIQQDKDFASRVNEIIIMGGAIRAAGNVEGFNTSEWNFYADPVAAKVVLESGIAVRLIPLDVIEYISCNTSNLLNRLSQIDNSSLSFAGKVLKNGMFWICDNWAAKLFYDMIAAAFVVNRERFESQNFQVQVNSTDGSISVGKGAQIVSAMKIVNITEFVDFIVNSVINN